MGRDQIGTVGYKLNGENVTMLQLMNVSGAALTDIANTNTLTVSQTTVTNSEHNGRILTDVIPMEFHGGNEINNDVLRWI